MRWIVAIFFSFLVFCWPAGAQPQSHVQVELLSASSALQPGQSSEIALHFRMDPEWHLYWTNPGLAGYPPRVKWQLPPGFQVGEPAWPVPKRMTVAGITGFVYEHELVLTFPLTVPADLKQTSVTLAAEVEWLACADTCIPGKARVQLALPVGPAQPAAHANLFTQARAQLPQTAGNLELRAWRLAADRVFLEFRGMPGDQADFFPFSDQDNVEEKEPVWKPDQGLEIPLPAGTRQLAGLLVTENAKGRQGVAIQVPILDRPPAAPSAPAGGARPASSGFTLWTALLSAFFGGIVLNLMPCVFPVLSLKALSLVEHNEAGKPAWLQGWVYTFGVLISVWLIAAPIMLVSRSGESAGYGWGWQMQSPLFVFGLAALFLAIALNLFGLFEVGEKLTQLASLAEGKKGLSESFWSGAVATIAATPCTAPFMAGAVGYAVQQPALGAWAIFTGLGLGIAFPYLVLCGLPKTRGWLPRPGAWMESFKQCMGFPMLLAVVWFLYILANLLSPEGLAAAMAALVMLSLAAWVYGRWGYSPEGSVRLKARLVTVSIVLVALGSGATFVSDPHLQAQGAAANGVVSEGELSWVPFTPTALEKLRAEKQAVFIDFTAAWCVNCKVNERLVLARKEVVEAFRSRGVVAMKADWTRGDPAITQLLAQFGRTGVPFYVLYPRSGEPIALPETLTPQIVLEALSKS